jgi:hypothetical protein
MIPPGDLGIVAIIDPTIYLDRRVSGCDMWVIIKFSPLDWTRYYQ